MTRVVITGMGTWCSLGENLNEFYYSLTQGKDGRRTIPVERFDTTSKKYRTHSAAVISYEKLIEKARVEENLMPTLAITVALEALNDANLKPDQIIPAEAGVSLGTTVGGSYAFMKLIRGREGLPGGEINPSLFFYNPSTITGDIAKYFGFRGPLSTISTACAAGTNSVGRAFDLIRKNKVKYMIAGGVDFFTELTFSGFNSLQALSQGSCRPFDRERDGLMLGDAGAFLLCESLENALSRGARIYAEIVGYAIANEAYHATGPDPEGMGALMVMSEALTQGKLQPEDVGYINAHGTATNANDDMELRAIRKLLGSKISNVYVSSTKSMTGHALGAAGSIELIATTLALYHHFIPPTINTQSPTAEYSDFRFVFDKAIQAEINAAISNSFGFGGNVASIAVKTYSQ